MRSADSHLLLLRLEEERDVRTSRDAASEGLRDETNASAWNTADIRAVHAASVAFAFTTICV